ncbi:RNA polymerase sigma-70 factor (ECF subfamily) [Micromonospora jinlongensis]|uniref:RNA polymerase sigma-70 factor (ECF subfamily) n=1 Tax=Micromonospora jinlongensis TaxID=1287877 RepID=A0A7Y9WZ42_9ACTN|nr:sigma-70 family RNA polymerase sigma factor [Micromonospora jinlongensis]NYH42212.1 RNA polymerase sigma-70 factor (ECF subfamily) [Micromonospora jinlongensis]
MSTPQRRPVRPPAPAGAVAAAAAQAVGDASVEAYPRIVATLIRVTGDWALAEDCAQEALAVALERWPTDGVPANPGGWLMTVARNRALDVLRRATVERRKLHDLALLTPPEGQPGPAVPEDVVDDRLRLIFTCCHPALAIDARVALTLRTVCGVPTSDIARLLLVNESTMTRRLTRARTRIAQAGIPYRVPSGPALTERLPGVLAVLYLLFTRGYVVDGEPAFADEAVRLARLLDRLMPKQSEVAALLALFLLQHSRRDARRDTAGNLLTLERQDRARWDRAAIAEGLAALDRVRHDGPYAWQARIAACHATAPSADATDWLAIARAYDALIGIRPSPVIALNRAVAHGYAYGPYAGLSLLDAAQAGGGLNGNPLAVAVRADLVARQGDRLRAAALFKEAAAMVGSDAERRALLDRAHELAG